MLGKHEFTIEVAAPPREAMARLTRIVETYGILEDHLLLGDVKYFGRVDPAGFQLKRKTTGIYEPPQLVGVATENAEGCTVQVEVQSPYRLVAVRLISLAIVAVGIVGLVATTVGGVFVDVSALPAPRSFAIVTAAALAAAGVAHGLMHLFGTTARATLTEVMVDDTRPVSIDPWVGELES